MTMPEICSLSSAKSDECAGLALFVATSFACDLYAIGFAFSAVSLTTELLGGVVAGEALIGKTCVGFSAISCPDGLDGVTRVNSENAETFGVLLAEVVVLDGLRGVDGVSEALSVFPFINDGTSNNSTGYWVRMVCPE